MIEIERESMAMGFKFFIEGVSQASEAPRGSLGIKLKASLLLNLSDSRNTPRCLQNPTLAHIPFGGNLASTPKAISPLSWHRQGWRIFPHGYGKLELRPCREL